ncbi:MAG: MaoC family dehydratase [Pirellulales bacterium]
MAVRTIDSADELRSLVGKEVGVSDWLDVTQEMIDRFAEVTRDDQWIHTDVERCRAESPFGTTIAHGFLTLSLLSYLHRETVQIGGNKMAINYGLNRVRFVSPVRCGSRIRTRSKVLSVDDFAGGVQVTWHINVEVEGQDKPALVAEWIGRQYQ